MSNRQIVAPSAYNPLMNLMGTLRMVPREHFQMSLQRQHLLLSFLKILSVDSAGV